MRFCYFFRKSKCALHEDLFFRLTGSGPEINFAKRRSLDPTWCDNVSVMWPASRSCVETEYHWKTEHGVVHCVFRIISPAVIYYSGELFRIYHPLDNMHICYLFVSFCALLGAIIV